MGKRCVKKRNTTGQ